MYNYRPQRSSFWLRAYAIEKSYGVENVLVSKKLYAKEGPLLVGLYFEKALEGKGLGKAIGIWQSLIMKTRWEKEVSQRVKSSSPASMQLKVAHDLI